MAGHELSGRCSGFGPLTRPLPTRCGTRPRAGCRRQLTQRPWALSDAMSLCPSSQAPGCPAVTVTLRSQRLCPCSPRLSRTPPPWVGRVLLAFGASCRFSRPGWHGYLWAVPASLATQCLPSRTPSGTWFLDPQPTTRVQPIPIRLWTSRGPRLMPAPVPGHLPLWCSGPCLPLEAPLAGSWALGVQAAPRPHLHPAFLCFSELA